MGDDTWFTDAYTEQQLCQQLNQVRIVGNYNMVDRYGVASEANRLGLYELATWLADRPDEYFAFLMGDVFGDYVVDHRGAD